MKKNSFTNSYKEVKTIYSGEFISAKFEQNIAFHTILGSCVAACLYDEKNKIFGLNHFMLTYDEERANGTPISAKYGVHAMELLINDMASKGANRNNLKAKVFGGASPLKSMKTSSVGTKNIDFILNFRKREIKKKKINI